MPAEPPTTVSNASRPGHGIVLLFANGSVLGTTNDVAGALTVTSGARKLSNSPALKDQAWVAVCGGGKQFPPQKDLIAPPTKFVSWKIDQSAL